MKAVEAVHKTHQSFGGAEHSVAGDVIEIGFSLTARKGAEQGADTWCRGKAQHMYTSSLSAQDIAINYVSRQQGHYRNI